MSSNLKKPVDLDLAKEREREGEGEIEGAKLIVSPMYATKPIAALLVESRE